MNCAQTNIQLFNQLTAAGYSQVDLERVRVAYDLACWMFGGMFRPCGKTFVAHLVGTASVLATLHADGELVAAGLVHAAYFSRQGGVEGWLARRRAVQEKLGSQVHSDLACYRELKWNAETMLRVHREFSELEPGPRRALLIRLANELEEHLDLALLYSGEGKRSATMFPDADVILPELATRLGHDELARSLTEAFVRTRDSEVNSSLVRPMHRSFLISELTPDGVQLSAEYDLEAE